MVTVRVPVVKASKVLYAVDKGLHGVNVLQSVVIE